MWVARDFRNLYELLLMDRSGPVVAPQGAVGDRPEELKEQQLQANVLSL